MPMIECWDCGKKASDTADACPHCGANLQHGIWSLIWLVAMGLAILAFVLALMGG